MSHEPMVLAMCVSFGIIPFASSAAALRIAANDESPHHSPHHTPTTCFLEPAAGAARIPFAFLGVRKLRRRGASGSARTPSSQSIHDEQMVLGP
jgi:hypothetical protein